MNKRFVPLLSALALLPVLACQNPVLPIDVLDEWRAPCDADADCIEVVTLDACGAATGCPNDAVAASRAEDFAAARSALEAQCPFGVDRAGDASVGECSLAARCVESSCLMQ